MVHIFTFYSFFFWFDRIEQTLVNFTQIKLTIFENVDHIGRNCFSSGRWYTLLRFVALYKREEELSFI